MLPSPYMQNITVSPNPPLNPYRANARMIPPTMAMLPAICVAAALVETGEADEVELPVAEVLVEVPLVSVVERVTFELEVGARVAVALVEFALEEVEITVLVEDGTEDVDVLVTTGV